MSSLVLFHLMYEARSPTGTQSSLIPLVKLAGLLQGSPSLLPMHLGYHGHHTCPTHCLDAGDPNSGPHTVTSTLPSPRIGTLKNGFNFFGVPSKYVSAHCQKELWCKQNFFFLGRLEGYKNPMNYVFTCKCQHEKLSAYFLTRSTVEISYCLWRSWA